MSKVQHVMPKKDCSASISHTFLDQSHQAAEEVFIFKRDVHTHTHIFGIIPCSLGIMTGIIPCSLYNNLSSEKYEKLLIPK